MSEITKLYENAEPNRDCNLYKHFTECPMKHTQCEDCENFVYPPFTAEKQLKIMELLGEVHAFFDADKTNFACITNYRIEKGIIKGYEGKGESVSGVFASLVNNLWQSLTEEERKQIKEILE